jgi:hypothetical protein
MYGVHEALRQVAAKLTLCDVVFLCEKPRWPAGGPMAFEPAERFDSVALVVVGKGHDEAAQQERAFLVAKRMWILGKPVDVAVLAELPAHDFQRGASAGIVRGRRCTYRREQEGGIGPRAIRCALP